MKALVLAIESAEDEVIWNTVSGIDGLEAERFSSLDQLRNSASYSNADALVFCVDHTPGVDEEGSNSIANLISFLECDEPNVLAVLIFKERPDIDSINRLIELSCRLDLSTSENSFTSINAYSSDDTKSLKEILGRYVSRVSVIDAVELNYGANNVSILSRHIHLLKLFANRFCGASCHLVPVDGGMSGSSVFKVTIRDEIGAERFHAIAKLDSTSTIGEESRNFTDEVTRLLPHAYAPQVCVLQSGTDSSAGAFYRLLSEGYRPLMSLILDDVEAAAEAVGKLKDLFGPWSNAHPTARMKVSEIRRRLVSDEKLEEILKTHEDSYNFDWVYSIENSDIIARPACIHGDLHSANVFVDNQNNPIIIDFGDVGNGSVALDPITLELSIFTHPSMSKKIAWYPSLDKYSWANLNEYVSDSPYASYITACRNWAHDIGGGDREVNACAYAYLMRQLGYSDVDSNLVYELLISVQETMQNAP